MVEEIIGKRSAEDIFFSAMLSGMVTEKKASDLFVSLEKRGGSDLLAWLKGIGGALMSGGGMVVDTAKAIPPALGWTALLGASAGGLGAMGYDALKERVTEEDPEAKFNAEIEALYAGKNRELDDAKWMARMRKKRDRLKREWKKMDPQTYAKEYASLVSDLDSHKEIA